MLFNERCPLQMENCPGKELNGIVQTKWNSPQAAKILKFSIFSLTYALYEKNLCLSFLFFKRMVLYDMELHLFEFNLKGSYYIIDIIKLHSFCFTISFIQIQRCF